MLFVEKLFGAMQAIITGVQKILHHIRGLSELSELCDNWKKNEPKVVYCVHIVMYIRTVSTYSLFETTDRENYKNLCF